MITIILEDSHSNVLDKVSMQGNERFLINTSGPLLGRLDEYSYDSFSASDTDELISELNDIRANLSNDAEIEHVNLIVRLALRCKNKEGSTIVFTPFDK